MRRLLFLLVGLILITAAISEITIGQNGDQNSWPNNASDGNPGSTLRNLPADENNSLPSATTIEPGDRKRRRRKIKLPYCDQIKSVAPNKKSNESKNNGHPSTSIDTIEANKTNTTTTPAPTDSQPTNNTSPTTLPIQNSPSVNLRKRKLQCPKDCLAWQVDCKVYVCLRTGVLSSMELERPVGSNCHNAENSFGRCVSRWDFTMPEDD